MLLQHACHPLRRSSPAVLACSPFPPELFSSIIDVSASRPLQASAVPIKQTWHLQRSRRTFMSTTSEQDKPLQAKAPYSILFAGSDRFSCAAFQLLAEQDSTLIKDLSVLVPPDKRTSRGLKRIHRPPLRTLAESLEKKVHEVPSTGLRDWHLPPPFASRSDTTTAHNSSNLLITASFGYLIPQRILQAFPPLNTLNVHPSLLPKYRGAAPIQWSIMHGDNKTGVTIQTLGKRFDEGRILAQEEVDIPIGADYLGMEAELAQKGAELLVETLKDFPRRQEQSRAQDSSLATFARKLTSEDARVLFSEHKALDVQRKHSALAHQYPLWCMLQDKRVQLLDVEVVDTPARMLDLRTRPGIAFFDKLSKSVIVECAEDSWLAIRSLKTEARKALTAEQWWVGQSRGGQTVQLE